MFSWGVLSACTALVNNFAGIIVIRILLGACEAAFFPGATFLLSCTHRLRVGVCRVANSGLQAFTPRRSSLAAPRTFSLPRCTPQPADNPCSLLFSGSQLGNAFGTLLARAILELDGAHGLAGWKWLFIVEGVATVGLAIIFATFLPNLPKVRAQSTACLGKEWLTQQCLQNMWQLKPIEREMAMWRLELESGSTETPVKSWDAFV